jgi:diketogulonate reductase-like aldo/keto reductase
MRTIRLPDGGETVPVLGQGTWYMGEDARQQASEVRALRHGIELGLTLIDTAEMYGEGGAEEVVGEAVAGRREEVFLVSKVYPHNASRQGCITACERSLRRLRTDRIDLYLLHWRGRYPLAETVEAFEALRDAGKIRHWGVSNLDVADLEELWAVPDGERSATDQILYNVTRRGVEFDLLPWAQERSLPVMAYSPLEQARLPASGAIAEVARAHNATPFQVALAFVLRQPHVIAIPKAATIAHVNANHRALELELSHEDLAALDRQFPPPTRKQALEIL